MNPYNWLFQHKWLTKSSQINICHTFTTSKNPTKKNDYSQTIESGQTMLVEWKPRCMVCKAIIEFNRIRNISHQVSRFTKTDIGSSQSTLTIMEISMMCSFPLHNAFSTWEILQNIKPLCKHVNDKWKINGEPVAKLWLHKSQNKEVFFVFHTTYYLHCDQLI